MRVLAVVSYKGTKYQGWQIQNNAPTVEGTIEEALSRILNQPINIVGSGRTDAGVHAINQTFHFDLSKDMDLSRLQYSVNCLLPDDIRIKSMKEVSDDFHARYSAKGKIYEYVIHFGQNDVFQNELETTIKEKTDISLLEKCLLKFVGKHNFQDFTSKEEDENNFVRNIQEISFVHKDERLIITIIGDGFMRYMIRFMIGTALAVAQGKENIAYIDEHLSEKSARAIVSYKASSQGLYLKDVIYEY